MKRRDAAYQLERVPSRCFTMTTENIQQKRNEMATKMKTYQHTITVKRWGIAGCNDVFIGAVFQLLQERFASKRWSVCCDVDPLLNRRCVQFLFYPERVRDRHVGVISMRCMHRMHRACFQSAIEDRPKKYIRLWDFNSWLQEEQKNSSVPFSCSESKGTTVSFLITKSIGEDKNQYKRSWILLSISYYIVCQIEDRISITLSTIK